MKAKQKKIDTLDIGETGVDTNKRLEVLEVNEPEARKPGIIVPDIETLVDKLKNEAKVI